MATIITFQQGSGQNIKSTPNLGQIRGVVLIHVPRTGIGSSVLLSQPPHFGDRDFTVGSVGLDAP